MYLKKYIPQFTLTLSIMLCIMLYSCRFIKQLKAERPECYEVENAYSIVNMDVFKGFVDKMTVKDLIEIHGRPNEILDSYEVTSVEGYDIYEYVFPDGDIDCYIKNNVGKDNAIVEYIYYEPNNNMKLNDVIMNDSIHSLIKNSQSNIFYIGNKCSDLVRLRLDNNNKDEVVNIALNDISLLEEEKTILSYSKEIGENLPIQFGDFGEISKIDGEDGELRIYITVNDNPQNDIETIIKHYPDWASILATRMFGRFGIFNHMTQDIIRENTCIKFYLYSTTTKKMAEAFISSSSFQKKHEEGISNIEWIRNCVLYENLNLPQQLNEWLTCGPRRLEQQYLILRLDIKGEYERFNKDAEKLKTHDISLLGDPNNPDKEYIWLCSRCNYGLKKEYYLVDSKDTINVIFSPKEIKELIKRY